MGKNKGELTEIYVVLEEMLKNKTFKTMIFGNGLKVKFTGDLMYDSKILDAAILEDISKSIKKEILNLKTKGGVVESKAIEKIIEIFGKSISAPAGIPDLIIDGVIHSIKSLVSKNPDYICYKTNSYIKYLLDITDEDYWEYLKDLESTNKKIKSLAHNPLKWVKSKNKKITFVGPCVNKTNIELLKMHKKLPEIIGKIILASRTTSTNKITEILDKNELKIFRIFINCVEKGYDFSDKCDFDFEHIDELENTKYIFVDNKLNIKKVNDLGKEIDICDILYSDKPAFSKRATGKVDGLKIFKEDGKYYASDCLYLRINKKLVF